VTLDAIRRRDPAFDQTRFLARAEAVLALVLRARVEGRPEAAQAVASDDMSLRLRAEMEGQRAAGRHQVAEGVQARSSEIVEATVDDRSETVAVRFSLEGVAYEARADGKPVDGAHPGPRRWAELWWFQRAAGATTAASGGAPLDGCPGCGAPLAATPDGACAYCHHSLADPSGWMLARISAAPPQDRVPPSDIPVEASATGRVARTLGVLVLITVLFVIMGSVTAGVILASRTSRSVAAPRTVPSVSLPEGVTLPPGLSVPGATGPASTGFVTPVANPRVRAPVNDVAAAAAAVLAKVGRPLLASSIHLYPDGRIIFELQAADDPKGVDDWTWKAGRVSGPEQGLIGVDPSRLYPVAGLDLTSLARLCDAAVPATGIADGVVDSPYLLKIGTGLRWYIPVQSTSRRSTAKTYRVAPDGTKPEVF
jgi:hypothetical protein